MKVKRLLALLLILVVTLAGCGGGGAAEHATDSIIIGINSDATALDPLHINDTVTMSILSNVYEPLVRMTTDSEIVPALATDWTISPDGLEYTFTIRTDATFHNGDPITVEDIKYSIDMAVESSYTGPYMNFIDHTEIIDDSTVKIVLQYAYAPFLALCTTYSQIVKEDFYTDGGTMMSKEPIGSGPYKFVSWAQGDKIVFEAYEGYYAGTPDITQLTYKIISNSTTATIALETGDIDMYINVAAADIPSLEANSEITLLKEPSSAFYFIGLNMQDEKLSDIRVRQAIAKCVDRDALIIGALDGNGVKTTTFIAEGLPGYTEGFDPLPYNIEEAKALLTEAGYPDGFEMTISVPESRSAHAQMIQADLKKIGINLKIGIVESGAFWDALENGDYEMMIMGWSYVVMDSDVGYYSLYRSDDMAGNYVRFSDARVDELLQNGRISTEASERAAIYSEIEEIVMNSAAYIPLYWRMDTIAFDAGLTNIEIPPCGFYYVYDYAWEQ